MIWEKRASITPFVISGSAYCNPRAERLAFGAFSFVKRIHRRNLQFAAACLTAFFLAGTPVHAAPDIPAAGIVATEVTGLNVRSSASRSAPVLTSLPRGGKVTLLSRSGEWWRVQYGPGQTGYTHASYIRELSGSSFASVSASNLNVRSSPPKGTSVVVLSQSNGWSRILYHGVQIGYASSAYLSSDDKSAVSLALPEFKQTDPQWAALPIGTSGKTIAQIGCTTTALAMTESFRLGTRITPADMSRRLSYSPDGSLYWPANYRFKFFFLFCQ